jgi:hypothetical protein
MLLSEYPKHSPSQELMMTQLSPTQRRALRILDSRDVGAVYIDHAIGWIWKDDIRRDPRMAKHVIELAAAGERKAA